ncbi:MAG TPA: alanine dehydrogenase [Burkholderiales bacterium]|nr:alanine dehydrogenase [Burkholderiales bacterium]
MAAAHGVTMLIGVPQEIKNHEYRVGATPSGVRTFVAGGHSVRVQAGAGARAGFPDALYREAGAQLVSNAAAVYEAELVIKVKELQRSEFPLLHAGQIIYGYHHFAPDAQLLQAMLDARVACVAYETVTDAHGGLPLLTPMSQIAGRLAPQVGAWALQMANGGSGVLLGGVPGVAPARVVIVGGGIVGEHAARIATGMGADVTLLDRLPHKLAQLDEIYGSRLKTALSTHAQLQSLVHGADLVIGAVLLPGKHAPKLITRDDVAQMRPGSVIVDVAIDQGGICETSRPTSHTEPLYVEEGVVHYCVTNMPAAVARTATLALTPVTFGYALDIANKGLARAIRDDAGLRAGLQTCGGQVTHEALAQDTGREYVAPETACR